MSKPMAEVLAKHARRGGIRNLAIHCDCGWSESIAAMRSSKNSFAAHQAAALSAAGFGLVADAKAEAKRDAAAAGVRAVCDVWAAGGRATVRLSELSEIAKDITSGEWDQHIEWSLRDIDRERARSLRIPS